LERHRRCRRPHRACRDVHHGGRRQALRPRNGDGPDDGGLRRAARGILIYPAGIVELAGGLALATGYRARFAALLLALFTVAVTPIFHAFWAVPADQALVQMLFFTKNLAVFGGLLHVVARGTGRFALQRE